MIIVSRAIMGISLNGKEFLQDENGEFMLFNNVFEAFTYLTDRGVPPDVIDSFDFDEYAGEATIEALAAFMEAKDELRTNVV